jgi:transcriptional regulator with XRE-family HTH domain
MAAKLDFYDPYKPEFLKELRTRIGMSQPKLGELAGFSRDDIANFERGLTHIAVDDAVQLYEALATSDQSGDAISAALIAATALKNSHQDTLKSAKRDLIEKRKYVEAARRWLREAKANEKRIRALRGKAKGER